jgi:hypothetical protein
MQGMHATSSPEPSTAGDQLLIEPGLIPGVRRASESYPKQNQELKQKYFAGMHDRAAVLKT